MILEVDCYSGRPNPRFRLGEEHQKQLLALIKPHINREDDPKPGSFGFRGFTLIALSEGRGFSEIRVERHTPLERACFMVLMQLDRRLYERYWDE